MKIKQTIKLFVAVIALIGVATSTNVYAATPTSPADCPAGDTYVPTSDSNHGAAYCFGPTTCANSGGSYDSSSNTCTSTSGGTSSQTNDGCGYKGAILQGSSLCNSSASDPTQRSAIWGILLLVINILTAGVGVAAVGGLIYGAILWSAAGGNPGQVQKARQIITNVVIGIIAYALMFSFLNFLVPGGIFNKG